MKTLVYEGEVPPSFLRSPVATLGVFDALHKGHQFLLKKLCHWAKTLKGTSLVITFSPHPQQILRGISLPLLLHPLQKLLLLSQLGVEVIWVLPFTESLARLSAEDFLEQYLLSASVRHLLFGCDTRFGQGGKGDYDFVKKRAPSLGLSLQRVPPFCLEGEKVSSKKIREAVQKGDFTRAATWLGRPYAFFGQVIRGEGRGKQLGFPTANLSPKGQVTPPRGVYLVEVNTPKPLSLQWVNQEGKPLPSPYVLPLSFWGKQLGVANLGCRPTFLGKETLLEVHLLSFQGELYDHFLEVTFLKKIREEKKFKSLEELREQIQKDVLFAKEQLLEQGRK